MRINLLFSSFLILLCIGCVDRIDLPAEDISAYPIVIDGYISDEPGPYYITVSQAYDTQSKITPRENISAKRLTLSDDLGNSEELIEHGTGYYRTNPKGMQGTIGRIYKLKVELLDGRVYESKPDTLLASGKVDSVYFKFKSEKDTNGVSKYGFDVFFNATASNKSSYQYLWKFTGTYKTSTSCCTCWRHQRNHVPIVSDNQLVKNGQFRNVKADYVPVTGYTFTDKFYAEVTQLSLSRQAFGFWKAVKDQKLATGSLFQPVSGKIPNNFVQVSGKEGVMLGLFYATSVNSKGVFITRNDLPNVSVIPIIQLSSTSGSSEPGGFENPRNVKCNQEFPNSTNVKPSFWID